MAKKKMTPAVKIETVERYGNEVVVRGTSECLGKHLAVTRFNTSGAVRICFGNLVVRCSEKRTPQPEKVRICYRFLLGPISSGPLPDPGGRA